MKSRDIYVNVVLGIVCLTVTCITGIILYATIISPLLKPYPMSKNEITILTWGIGGLILILLTSLLLAGMAYKEYGSFLGITNKTRGYIAGYIGGQLVFAFYAIIVYGANSFD
ncbi:MAG: hypothetical protein ACM3PP_06605 [Candidatus Saccharibacteria bacterium]